MDVKKREIFCCKEMELWANNEEYNIRYHPSVRKYLLVYDDGAELEMKYCSFCGMKLPENLICELYSILSVDYGIENPNYHDFENNDKIPDQFKTSEWWKKLRL